MSQGVKLTTSGIARQIVSDTELSSSSPIPLKKIMGWEQFRIVRIKAFALHHICPPAQSSRNDS